jgi:hypothetical protein
VVAASSTEENKENPSHPSRSLRIAIRLDRSNESVPKMIANVSFLLYVSLRAGGAALEKRGSIIAVPHSAGKKNDF